MVADPVEYEPIGVIRTPFESPEKMPIQPAGAPDTTGTVEVEDAYGDGLDDLAEFSHCILLYHFHASDGDAPTRVEPFLDDTQRGLFATRAPRRPNPIGLSVVEISDVSEGIITVEGIDVVDGTPLLDIKPLVPEFDVPAEIETGWLESAQEQARSMRADDRFL
jgi:tRNA-Thr(GGU) m(6)t(6)A37 methyltransferase TsaA